MIYTIYKARDRWHEDSIQEFTTEKEALEYLKDKPRSGLVAVFKGERLEAKIGETKVVKKTIIGFGVKEKTEPLS